jgi:hypothetical protein
MSVRQMTFAVQAKRSMVGKILSQLSACAFVDERRKSSARVAHEAEIDGILCISDVLDKQGALYNCKFVASTLYRTLPNIYRSMIPEEMNLASAVERQLHIEATVKGMSAAVEQMATSRQSSTRSPDTESTCHLTAELQKKLEAFSSSVCVRVDHLNNVYSQLNTSISMMLQSTIRETYRRHRPQIEPRHFRRTGRS